MRALIIASPFLQNGPEQFSKSSRWLELMLCCAAFMLTACGPEPIVVNAPPPPAAWLVCADEPERPSLPGLTPLGTTYDKAQVDARDRIVAEYLLALRASGFSCRNQLAKVRIYFDNAK
jgi:hypothetical protein